MVDGVEKTDAGTELPAAPPRRRPRLSWSGKLGVCVVAFWTVIAFIGPSISPYHEADLLDEALFVVPGSDDPYPETDYRPPSSVAWLGTDHLGRDVLSRVLFGARTTIGISVVSALLAYLVGGTLGIAAAAGGRAVDFALCRLNDMFLSVPAIILAFVVVAALGSTIPILTVLVGLILATQVFPFVRSLALDVMVNDYFEAARVRGERLRWIVAREILPNIARPTTIAFGLGVASHMRLISSLSFLGVGVQPPRSDWGSMARESLPGLHHGSVAALVPVLAIATFTLAVNFIAEDVSTRAGDDLSTRMS